MFKKKNKSSFKLEASDESPLFFFFFFGGGSWGNLKNQKARMFPMKKRSGCAGRVFAAHTRTDSGASLESTALHSSSSLRRHSRFKGDKWKGEKKKERKQKRVPPWLGFLGRCSGFPPPPLLFFESSPPRSFPCPASTGSALPCASLRTHAHTRRASPRLHAHFWEGRVRGNKSSTELDRSEREREKEEEEEEEEERERKKRECGKVPAP